MALLMTEARPDGGAIDALSAQSAAHVLLDGQLAALRCVEAAVPQIAAGADAMAQAVSSGASLVYAAAGSSGLMALADACELPGTFGLSSDIIQIHMAGGVPVDGKMPGATEDDTSVAADVTRRVAAGDVAIVLSASGTTPYALEVAASAKAKGATVIGIANNPSTALLNLADIAICLKTPPEIIAGSTRMGAGTAQKAALNLMSSLMGVQLGHVYQGLMVNVVADNAKLLKRAAGIVARIAQVSGGTAQDALSQSGGDVKTAILIAAGSTPDAARGLLAAHAGHLGPCLQDLSNT